MSASQRLSSGSVVAGKFRVGELLGRGSMGWVFEAEHVDLGHAVAIKVIDPEGVDADALRRFRREGLALAKLESEHVVRVIDYGALPSGAPYLVMERLRGRDVAAHLKEHWQLSVGEAAEIVYQAADALAEAHGHGMVHRDLKPSNLFLADKPNGKRVTKVLDFGVSLLREQQGEDALTSNKAMLGTPFYMSPEQLISSHDVSHESDIWALGVILFQLVSGERPFPAKTIADLVNLLKRPAPSLLKHCPDAPREFAQLIGQCLELEPKRRFVDASALRLALEPFRNQDLLTGTIRSVASADPPTERTMEVAKETAPSLLAESTSPLPVRTPDAVLVSMAREAPEPDPALPENPLERGRTTQPLVVPPAATDARPPGPTSISPLADAASPSQTRLSWLLGSAVILLSGALVIAVLLQRRHAPTNVESPPAVASGTISAPSDLAPLVPPPESVVPVSTFAPGDRATADLPTTTQPRVRPRRLTNSAAPPPIPRALPGARQ